MPESTLNEEWRSIEGFEALYDVSDYGSVRSVERTIIIRNGRKRHVPERILKTHVVSTGYLLVHLWRENIRTSRQVHDLVARAFVGPRPAGMEIRHMDGNKLNNAPQNLVWGTSSENSFDQVRLGTHFWAKRTHCKWGHEFTEANTRIDIRGDKRTRVCRQCQADRFAAYLDRKVWK